MLSVQSPGCAGMERLGVPARGSIGSPPIRNERAGFHHQQQTQQQQQQQQQQQSQQQHQQQQQQQHPQQHQPSSQQNHHRHHHHQYHQQTSPTDQHLRFSSDLILSSSTSSNFRSNHNQSYLLIPHQTNALGGSGGGGSSGSNSINYKTHYSNSSYGGSSIGSTGTTNPITTNFPHCTYHVPLPDGEYGPDRDLQIRTPCQQSEIPRTYVKAPPNKTVRDVPVQYQSTGGITAHGTTMTAGIGTGTGHVNSMVDLASYYGGAKTIGRPVDGGRLAATAPGPSLGGNGGTCQQKSVDKLQKIFRFLPGKATKSSTPSSSTSSTASSSSSTSSSSTSSSSSSGIKSTSNNINNNHQGANASFGGLQPPAHPGVLPGSHSSSTGSLNNNSGSSTIAGGSGAIASGSVISSISGSYGPNSVSNSIGCSNHVNNNRVGCGSAGGNIRVDGRGGLSLATAGAGIHNHNQHYRSPPVAVSSLGSPSAATLSSPTSSSSSASPSSSSSSSPLASTVVRPAGVDAIVSGSSTTGPVVPGSSSDPGHAPFTM